MNICVCVCVLCPTLIKIRKYLTLVQSILLYASETWTLTSAYSRSLEAFHIKCQRRILRIFWQQFVRTYNEEVRAQTGLSSILDIISRRRIISIFGYIAILQDSVSAHKALAVLDFQYIN